MLVIIVGDVLLLMVYYGANSALNYLIQKYKEYKQRKQEKFKEYMYERKKSRLSTRLQHSIASRESEMSNSLFIGDKSSSFVKTISMLRK